jgi:AraC-like DNA-binding protein
MNTELPQLLVANEESWQTPDYYWDNAVRPDAECCVIQRTLSGEAFWQDDSGRHFVSVERAMLYTHSETTSYGYSPSSTMPYQLQFIAFHAGCLRPIFDRLRERFGSVILFPSTGICAHLFETILQRYQRRDFPDTIELTEMITRLLSNLWREQLHTFHDRDPVQYGHYLIHNDPYGKIRVNELPHLIGITREHFIREYAKRYGTTPGRMHRRLRLNRVHAMLRATTLPIEEIALNCGFSGADALRRAYKSYFGKNPSEHR